MEADKVKKKLHGAILKGKKVKIEEARPGKRKHANEEIKQQQHEDDAEPLSRESKKARKERDVLPGHELPSDRKIKRGWTENKAEKSNKKKDKSKPASKPQTSSKYTEKDELLFRTKVPKNKISTRGKDVKKDKKEADNTIVHEFEKTTTMPSFLRSTAASGKMAAEYEDGKGWLDEEGNVVELEDQKASTKRKAAQKGIEAEVLKRQPKQLRGSKKNAPTKNTVVDTQRARSTSPSDASSTDATGSGDDDDDDDDDEEEEEETSSSGSSEDSMESSTSEDDDNGKGESEASTPPKPTVHPLEALFKKPLKPASSRTAGMSIDVAKPSLEVQTSFSFFESHDSNDSLPPMPMTPFSSQDLQTREIRSAAPTPDTAHPSRLAALFNRDDSEGELSEMEDGGDKNAPITRRQDQPSNQQFSLPQTDFEKQFWEKRGENNRAWKARRRAVLKEKRQRENRARRPKNW